MHKYGADRGLAKLLEGVHSWDRTVYWVDDVQAGVSLFVVMRGIARALGGGISEIQNDLSILLSVHAIHIVIAGVRGA